MGMATVYRPPVKPKAGFYLEHHYGHVLWKIRHVSRKTGIITAERKPGCVLKVHKKYLDDHFTVRSDI